MSVIVPAFNAAATIEQTLHSVLAQTYDDWEVVVGDDCSTDDTVARARSVSDDVVVIRAQRNGGPAAARNLAVAHAHGELLALLDADDRWLPDYLLSQVGAYDRARAEGVPVGVVSCDALLEDEEGRALSDTYRDRVAYPDVVTLDTLLEGNPIFVSALVPAELVRAVGGFDTRTHGSEDHDLWCKILERGLQVVDNPAALAVYRLGSTSVSAQRAGMAHTSQTTYRLALARGRLDSRQRRLARRQLRLQQSVEAVERLIVDPSARRSFRALVAFATGVAGMLSFVAVSPGRWVRWLRTLPHSPAAWRRGAH